MALMVGVSGVRGLVGETLTPQLVLEFAQAFGTTLGGGRVVLARDTRPSGAMFAAAVEAGLQATGCSVTRLDVAMTPTVGHAIVAGGYDGGVSITASHNPAPWNGLKFLDRRGLAPDPAFAAEIARVREERAFRTIKAAFQPVASDADAGQRHAAAVLKAVEVDLNRARGMRIVLDSVNGAGCLITPGFLRELGCDVIHVNGEPTGDFAHSPEPLAENLTQLCDAVRTNRAAVGFAQDPDADRLAIVDEAGCYIGEEYTLALCGLFVLARRPGPVAVNLSTSRLIDAIAKQRGTRVIRTAVGEANVARGIVESGAVLGGEGNGGVIDPRICLVRDSLSAMSLVLQLMAETGRTIGQLVAELPHYVMIKHKFECPRERIAAAAAAVARDFAALQPNTSDGTRVDFPEGWVHLRASNTEPIVRIMAEAASREEAERLVARIRTAAGL